MRSETPVCPSPSSRTGSLGLTAFALVGRSSFAEKAPLARPFPLWPACFAVPEERNETRRPASGRGPGRRALQKCQEIGVDLVLVGRAHAVRQAGVHL